MSFSDDSIDIITPINVPLSAKYKRSFAYITVKDRLPVILTKVVDYLARDKEHIAKKYGEEAKEELKTVIGYFSKLKNELQTNKALKLLTSSGEDVPIWNAFLLEDQAACEGSVSYWYSSPWLYVECYMYRRFREAFELSKSLQTFDPFRKQKETALWSSESTMFLLAAHLEQTLANTNKLTRDETRKEMLRMLHMSLWGNRCDLSISSGDGILLNEDPLSKVDELQDFVLVDDSDKVWEALADSHNQQEAIVDIVLDNAGYEVFVDMCLADLLLGLSLANCVRIHAKTMPWFVSDVLPADLHWAVGAVGTKLPNLAARWQAHLDSGRWKLQAEDFWTLPHDYSRMAETDPKLYGELAQAKLVIFKGDLNYRKLTGDINWKPTESFETALRGFTPTKIVALRTIKADVVCGLAPGQAETVAAKSPDWLVTGQYALLQFNK